jgi:hypothetical protein
MSIGSQPAVAADLQRTFAGSAKVARPVGLPAFTVFAIHLLVFGSLFSGLPGPAALGELRGEGTVIGAVAVILAAVLSGAIMDLRGLRSALIFLPLVAWIALSYAVNAEEIANAHFLGREGGEKFFTSLLVVLFYFSVFFSVSCIANVYGVRAMLLCASDAAVWCGFLMVAEMAVEIVSWFVPPLREVWRETRLLWVSSGSSEPLGRLVGFAPEPSLGAITAMGLIGLLAAEVVIRGASGQWPRVRSRAVGFLILALFALELLLANARTFAIGAFGVALAAFLLSPFARSIPAALKSAAIVLATLPAQAGLIWVAVQQEPSARSISNISRSVGMITASELGAQHPLFGLGLGQYGFHFRSVVPSWGLESFDFSKYFREDQYDLLATLPPSFSMFSRVAAELGLIGLAAWLFPPLFAIRRAIVQRPGPLTAVIICALAAQIWSGLSFDSFRNVYYWVWLALLLAWSKQNEGVTRPASSGFAAKPGVRGVG